MFRKVLNAIFRHKIVAGAVVAGTIISCTAIATFVSPAAPVPIKDELVALANGWPSSFAADDYVEPEFVDDAARTNNAFNVADFGEQGNNGWFYRYGSSLDPVKSKRMESFDGEKYFQLGQSGMEIKSNFIHTSEASAPILEWRAADKGKVNIHLTYVKNVNNDPNPSYPDGVTIYVYKGEESIARYEVDISTEKETVIEEELKDISVEELESLYFIVDPNMNNAYDGGSLYVAINDVNVKAPSVMNDASRTSNNANLVDDFGDQGQNGWTYMCGKNLKGAHIVSTQNNGEYMNSTSPNLVISQNFIHPAINDKAIIAWQPAIDGPIEVRGSYTKFEQNDGNPSWPDGVAVSVFKNGEKLYQENVAAPSKGENTVKFRQSDLNVTTGDKLYFVVDARGNSSYDGGYFDINIIDRTGATTEADVTVEEPETRQNFADVKYDFGEQGNNGWFFQDGFEDEPFNAYNMQNYETEEERYFDSSYLEIKRDFVNPGKGKSAVIKWKVAQTGDIKIDASYTKFKNEDKNPSWPDGTKVTIYHNNEVLMQQEFEADTAQEITKRLDVASVSVVKDDFITMVVNGKGNNAYDGGKYEFSIKGISPLVGKTHTDVTYLGGERTNNASLADDFGKQGANGWCYQFGYYNKPSYAANVETYKENEKYTTSDGVEIKKDYIIPGNKGKNANVKWVAAQTGSVDLMVSYTKLKNEDANPDWPDGVTVYLMRNDEVLKQEDFAPLVDRETTKDLSMDGVWLNAGDCITLLVDGKENTAYDGGNFTFVIEDSDLKTVDMVNNSGENYANLALDFGDQGSNGWYYLEGRSVEKAEILTRKTEDGSGYTSRKLKGLEIKKDFIQPRLNAHAMYKWVVAEDGQINILGNYAKFGNEDPNMDWPDGATVNVYLNRHELYGDVCTCPRGADERTYKDINISNLDVKKGDIITFDIGCNKNNAWDGGRLDINIEDANGLKVGVGDIERSNTTVLGAISSMEQGTDGWWFLEGTTPSDAKVLHYMNEDKSAYLSTSNEGLEIKKDYVHPGKNAAAIYQWVAYADGKIDILGDYVKFAQNDENPDFPDGVKLQIFVNDSMIYDQDVAVFAGDGNDNKVEFMFTNQDIHRGDKISFMIFAKDNNAYDAGKLSVSIYEVKENMSSRTNRTSLAGAFGEQGSDGWYYGMCDWDGTNFEQLGYDAENGRYYNNGKPELKSDYVEPGNGKNAAYKWEVAQTGKIYVKGSYTKFVNSADSAADGVVMRIFINGSEKKFIGVTGNFSEEVSEYIDEEYTVHAGDEIMFAINPEGNDSYDGGRLEIRISDTDDDDEDEELRKKKEKEEQEKKELEEKEKKELEKKEKEEAQKDKETATGEEVADTEEARTNNTNLKDSFGEQGSDGWYYGTCEWNGQNFNELEYNAKDNRYYNNGKPELKSDFVEPGNGQNAAYRWIVAKDGSIRVYGNYTKFANSSDPNANGTCMRIFLNDEEKLWLGGDTQGNYSNEVIKYFDEHYNVKANDKLTFAIDPDGNDAWDGGRLEVNISSEDEEESDADTTTNNAPEEKSETSEPEEAKEEDELPADNGDAEENEPSETNDDTENVDNSSQGE